jgi:hypothetical protein
MNDPLFDREYKNLQRWYQYERDNVRRLTNHVGVQWGVRWPNGDITACGDKGGAEYGVKYSFIEPGGVLIRRTISEWEEVVDGGKQ